MRTLFYIIITFSIAALCSCGRHQSNTDDNKTDKTFDFSLFYRVNERDKYIFDAHQYVPLGKMVTLNDLDRLFGTPFVCDTVLQTQTDWSLYEQESQAAQFLPTEKGDTLVMMRRIYGQQGDWLIWIDLEIQHPDSLRVLNFIAYDNSQIEI